MENKRMQKEVLYKYDDNNVSDYQQKDLAIYNVEMQNPDMEQIKKLTENQVSFTIPQLNINYCNSFNENYNITIRYQNITIYDMNLFIAYDEIPLTHDHISQIQITDQDGKRIWASNIDVEYNYHQNHGNYYNLNPTDLLYPLKQKVQNLRFNDQYSGTSVKIKPYTFSLQQQSINSLIENLNYPLKHIPYGIDQEIYYPIEENGVYYKTRVQGELDITSQVYWDTYNGKLRFNYNGIKINTDDFLQLFIESGTTYPQDIDVSGQHDYGNLGKWPMPVCTLANTDFSQITQYSKQIYLNDNPCTYNFSYWSTTINTNNPLNNVIKSSLNNIYVQQIDPTDDHLICHIDNAYWSNQLLGFMQSPQQLLDFMQNYTPGQIKTLFPQTYNNNYAIYLSMINNNNKYLKNLRASFVLRKLETSDGFTSDYVNRSVVLAREFFLQLWREVYVLSPQLQSNTIIFKPENIKYTKTIQYCNTNNANGTNYVNNEKNDTHYIFSDKLNCIAYYVNSVSFNNYVSLQNNYPLQYQSDQKFDVESLRSLTFILTDENGMPLPRLSEFKVYLQFQQDQDNTAQNKTTNFNRVLTDN